MSLIALVHGTVLLILLIIKISSGQLEVYPLAKIFFYLEIYTWPPTLNLGSFLFDSSLYSAKESFVTSTGFIFIVL